MNSMLTSCLLWVSVVSFNHYCYCYEYKMSGFSSFDITLTIQVYCICWLFSITIGKVCLCYLRRIKGFVYIYCITSALPLQVVWAARCYSGYCLSPYGKTGLYSKLVDSWLVYSACHRAPNCSHWIHCCRIIINPLNA